MRSVLAAIAALAMLACAQAADLPMARRHGQILSEQATSDDATAALIRARMDELVAWIARNSALLPASPPATIFLTRDAINRITYGKHYSGQDSTLAMYFPNLMVLPVEFELGKHDHVLLHELVHHMQFNSGTLKYVSGTCMAEIEREAYALQNRFVDETGIGEKADDFFLFTLVLACHGG